MPLIPCVYLATNVSKMYSDVICFEDVIIKINYAKVTKKQSLESNCQPQDLNSSPQCYNVNILQLCFISQMNVFGFRVRCHN